MPNAIRGCMEEVDELWEYNFATREPRLITAVNTPSKVQTYPTGFTVGAGEIAWWVTNRVGGRTEAEIHTVRRSGGPPRTVDTLDAGTLEEPRLDKLVISDGRVYASLGTFVHKARTGVYEAPLSGGPATLVRGTAGHEIVSSPWVGAPNGPNRTGKERSFTGRSAICGPGSSERPPANRRLR